MDKTAIVVGAGIVGLATAHALAVRGYRVTVVEREEKAVGASVRNFGMIWPIGQPVGHLFDRAIKSRSIWKSICDEASIWYEETGSLHVAHAGDEEAVLEEFFFLQKQERDLQLLTSKGTIQRFEAVAPSGLRCGLFSPAEVIVDPREAIAKIPQYLSEKFGVQFLWSHGATEVYTGVVQCGARRLEADEIFVCNGADFATLFPEQFAAHPLTKCKLQMMRTKALPSRINTALCGGLSLIHYKSFAAAPSLSKLKARFEEEFPDQLRWGIHVMVSQNESGQLTIGDSHEYGQSFDPFDKRFINDLILSYLNRFTQLSIINIAETWNGIYAKHTGGETEIVLHPAEGVTVINSLGGNGMTLSFGLCDEVVEGSYDKNKLTSIKPPTESIFSA